MLCVLCVGGLPPSQCFFFFLLDLGDRHLERLTCHWQPTDFWKHYKLWHKWLNESAHLLKGVFPPWCLDTISPYFVLSPNDWRRCAFIRDYWGLNLIELKRSPVNHITLSFLFTARRQKPPLAVTWQDTKVGVPAGSSIPPKERWSNED